MALMVDTWIEQRNDDNFRQEYLASLTDDLKTDQQNLANRISFFTDVHSFGLETLDDLQSEEPVNQDVLLAAYYAAENWNSAPVKNTYEDLQSTGNIRLFGDLDLRLVLAALDHPQDHAQDDGKGRKGSPSILEEVNSYKNSGKSPIG